MKPGPLGEREEKPQTARVVALGDSMNGGVEKDDTVLFARHSGTESWTTRNIWLSARKTCSGS